MRIIAGESRGRKLKSVKRTGTRPTMERVRESLFAILTPWLEDAHFLDLFAGSGSVGLEALSRGASRVAFVDINRGCIRTIQANLELLGQKDAAIVIPRAWSPALKNLSERGERFQIIFIDPPYEHEAVLFPVAERVQELQLLHNGGWLIFQHTIRLGLPEQFGDTLRRTDSRRFGETMLTFFRYQITTTSDH